MAQLILLQNWAAVPGGVEMSLTAEPVTGIFLQDSKDLTLTSSFSCTEMRAVPGAFLSCETAPFLGLLGEMRL